MQTATLSPNAKVWIYQSTRPFTPSECLDIQESLQQFVNQWKTHGQSIYAKATIHYKQFIILMADAHTLPSGCAIDSSVHFVEQIGQKYNIDLFNRLLIAYKKNDQIELINRKVFKQRYASGEIDDNTLIFNNLVQTKAEFDQAWEIPLAQSWHKRFVK